MQYSEAYYATDSTNFGLNVLGLMCPPTVYALALANGGCDPGRKRYYDNATR